MISQLVINTTIMAAVLVGIYYVLNSRDIKDSMVIIVMIFNLIFCSFFTGIVSVKESLLLLLFFSALIFFVYVVLRFLITDESERRGR